jgi:hypothetical protein
MAPALLSGGETRWIGGQTEMEATIREARVVQAESMTLRDEITGSVRYAENALLSELPGLVFGLITLVYIVGSLVRLL